MDWVYFTLRADGRLIDEDGDAMKSWPKFSDVSAAEKYLIDNDIRGSVQS